MKVKINSDVIINEKGITEDLEKFAENCATAIVEEAAQLIKKFAYKQMVGYYGEYDPRIYKRTKQMLKSSYKPFVVTTGDIYEGGVIINSENTNHKRGYYVIDENEIGYGKKKGLIEPSIKEEYIYDNVWIKGSHGYENVGYGENIYWREIQGVPDRINKLKREAYSKEVKERLLSKGMNKAKSQSYSILNFS